MMAIQSPASAVRFTPSSALTACAPSYVLVTFSSSTKAIPSFSTQDHRGPDFPDARGSRQRRGSGYSQCHTRNRQEYTEIHPHCHRSEEHTSELQSRGHLVCRLLLEKKKRR